MTGADLMAQLDADWLALQSLRPRVEAGAPWPVSDTFDTTPEAYWFPPEVLAHVSELYALIGTGVVNLRARLGGLSDADLARRGRHVAKGETTVGELVSGSVTGHIAEHVRQIESLLVAAGR